MKTAKRFSTIIIWYGFAIYTLLNSAFTDYNLMHGHYINLALLAISTIAFFFGQPDGHLTTIFMLLIGFLGRGAITISVYTFSMFGLTVSWPYLPLIIYFIIVNRNEIAGWFSKVFSDKQKIDTNERGTKEDRKM